MSNICAPALNDIWNNEIITQKCFPNNPKVGDVTPVFKKEDASLLKNYRPRIMQKQILEYIGKHLSPQFCGYRKGYSNQTALTSMLEKWKLCIDNKCSQVVY